MDKKDGVYICEGCGIGDALDMKALCEIPEEEGVPVKTHPVLCGKDGVALLKKDIEEGTNTLVISSPLRISGIDRGAERRWRTLRPVGDAGPGLHPHGNGAG